MYYTSDPVTSVTTSKLHEVMIMLNVKSSFSIGMVLGREREVDWRHEREQLQLQASHLKGSGFPRHLSQRLSSDLKWDINPK